MNTFQPFAHPYRFSTFSKHLNKTFRLKAKIQSSRLEHPAVGDWFFKISSSANQRSLLRNLLESDCLQTPKFRVWLVSNEHRWDILNGFTVRLMEVKLKRTVTKTAAFGMNGTFVGSNLKVLMKLSLWESKTMFQLLLTLHVAIKGMKVRSTRRFSQVLSLSLFIV